MKFEDWLKSGSRSCGHLDRIEGEQNPLQEHAEGSARKAHPAVAIQPLLVVEVAD